jgi:hypothetical protein
LPTPPITDEYIARTVAERPNHETNQACAAALGLSEKTVRRHMALAAERGLLGTDTVLPGFAIRQVTSKASDGTIVQQRKAAGDFYAPTETLAVKGKTTWINPEGRITQQVVMERAGAQAQLASLRAMVDAIKEELPRLVPSAAPHFVDSDKMNQFIVTDSHFGMLAWAEETGADYDLRIAEQLLLDWFAYSIYEAPPAHTAVFAQLGDLMHHDALESVTPAHRHVLDADSRLQKIVRVVIRTVRRAIAMLLERHQHVHVIMASGNHDPAGSVWLREMLAVMYEDEPRIAVDTSPRLYYKHVWGDALNLYHHGHKADLKNIDKKFAAEFRTEFGASKYAYGHVGHKHSDEGIKTELMYIERHETLAARDAYAAGGPWWSGRSAKRITYDKRFGESGRSTARPEMVAGAYVAANDNNAKEMAA